MGIRLNSLFNGINLDKPVFKPASGFVKDPVRSSTVEQMKNIPAFKPGSSAPDPVPSIPADASVIPGFKTPVSITDAGEMNWIEVNPIPAKGV